MKNPLFSVWEGVFKSFSEAGGDLDAFDSDIWIEKQKKKIKNVFNEYEKGNTFSRDYPLPLVLAMVLAQKKKVSVLDFGGGMGMQYLDVLGKVPNAKESVEYVILDGNVTIRNVPNFMNQFKKLRYYSDLTQVKRKFDIVHIGSTLQYIEDWRGLLTYLVQKFDPLYFVFSDLMTGNIPTFVSHQIFYGKRIPHIFLSSRNFLEYVQRYNYKIIFHSKFIHEILGQEKIFPNFGLPKCFQLDRPSHLVFMRI